MQAANLSFQASGFGCSPGRDAILYFAEARTLTFDVNKYPKSSFTVDLIGGVQHHPAQQVCNGSHHHHLHPPLAHDLSGQVLFGQTSVFALLTLPATAPEHGFKEENEINAHYVGIRRTDLVHLAPKNRGPKALEGDLCHSGLAQHLGEFLLLSPRMLLFVPEDNGDDGDDEDDDEGEDDDDHDYFSYLATTSGSSFK